MKTKLLLLILSVLVVIALSACGPSPEELNATSTQVANDIFSTQTAQAPTSTSTYTPTPTATSTPTPTPTATSTSTPSPTATPTPSLVEIVAITLNDMPPGFIEMPSSQLSDMEQALSEGDAGFGFTNETDFQVIMGLIIHAGGTAEQASFDAALPEFVRLYATAVGASGSAVELTGIEGIGESQAGITAVSPIMSITMRWDIISFRRRSEVAIVISGYQDGTKHDVTAQYLSQLLDERMILYLMPSIFPNSENADTISGQWTGTIISADDEVVSDINLDILPGCTVSNTCGVYNAVDNSCSGDLVLESTVGNTFIFAEQYNGSSPDCLVGGKEIIRLLSSGKLMWRFEYTAPSGDVIISKAVLEKQ